MLNVSIAAATLSAASSTDRFSILSGFKRLSMIFFAWAGFAEVIFVQIISLILTFDLKSNHEAKPFQSKRIKPIEYINCA